MDQALRQYRLIIAAFTFEILADEKNHLGIENVRNRLEKMCGGELIITSEKGNGTAALIRIPKIN